MLHDEPNIRIVRLSPADAGDKITVDAGGNISICPEKRSGHKNGDPSATPSKATNTPERRATATRQSVRGVQLSTALL